MKCTLVLQSRTTLRKRLIPVVAVFIELALAGYTSSPARRQPGHFPGGLTGHRDSTGLLRARRRGVCSLI
jgi:hypothetical protein